VATAAALVAAGNILSRLLGFVREPVIAALFGATGTADAFEVATRLPTMIFDVAIGGAVSAVLVPVFSTVNDDERSASDLFHSIAIAVTALAAALVIPIVIFADPLISLVASGFSPATHDLAVTMTRITMPAVLLLSISAVASGRLYAAERFAFPAFSVSALNATLIVGALSLTPVIGPPGVAVGYLAGAFAHLGIQIPGLILARTRLVRPGFFRDPRFRRALALYAPVLAGLIFAQVIVLIDTRLASGTGEGSLAMMRFATRLQQFPLGVVVAAVTLAMLPLLSRTAPERFADLPAAGEFKVLLGTTIRYLLLLIVPVTVLMIGLTEPIIRVVYLRGEFATSAVDPTARALLIYSLQLPLVALDQLFIFAYYSARNTLTPVLVGVAGGLVYLLVAFATVDSAGFHGLVWANTAQNAFHAAVLGLLLWRAVGGVGAGRHAVFAGKLAMAIALMIAGLALLRMVAAGFESDPGVATLVIGGAGGLLIYGIAAWTLRIDEARDLNSRLRTVLARFRPASG
jgi:putative peptidoglycan lipid II flippase